ncbi:MAG: bifunctional D-altronate/D-mannonate dehydratase [Treponema sp.]|jgi:mannonate dehydratase|nr:bifunctional D-altronate/D-mannonate dehydratase [Treponema sp.]
MPKTGVTIRKVRAILTAPAGINLIVVKVETSEPELYGLGCATFAYREKAVQCMVEEYLDPLLAGRDAGEIEGLWQLMNNNSYWRNGPVTNNAISGADMALWDIKGKLAGMPLYDLLGGRSRNAAAVYRHADGKTLEDVERRAAEFLEQNVRHIRIQWGGYGGKAGHLCKPAGAPDGAYYDPDQYMRDTVRLFEHIRGKLGGEFELLHDVHERLSPIAAVRLAKELEPFKLFFLEDLLSPEQGEWFRMIRSQCATPIANGELYNNPKEWSFLITERLIDFIRVHISQIGGITPARKLAIFCEQFGIRTAWHGPGDVSPVGHAANIHLDLVCHNFGIQEWSGISGAAQEVFPGSPELRDGYVYANSSPGLGIDLNEKLAARYPCRTEITRWTQTRLPDGTVNTP